ncbi:MAG: hypothetical protein N4A48_07480 [Tepidibacter sp.]|jgi:hypothetical protein|uniref:hypothetical protein n=1 Tax=Tepidibacter sp. TaxID=2529387 RepID=UPI0025F90269|nr:hypothetical protein [Tepidibacter sp.]MCT4508589.1 hypothetical protein [Tepidibacter sp.]
MAKKRNKANKNPEMNAREASKRMGLEQGAELGLEEMGANFSQGSRSNKSPNANQKRNRKNNK